MAAEAVSMIAEELGISIKQVEAVSALLASGATVPFISRYRKEATGSLDEVEVASVRDRLSQIEELEKRRTAIIGSLVERDLMTPELREKIEGAGTRTVLEDIYLPYRPKRRTRATIAREKGLEPLAMLLLEQDPSGPADLMKEAMAFTGKENGAGSAAEALEGARDIIAEMASEDRRAREALRRLFREKGIITSRGAGGEDDEAGGGSKYRDYLDWSEPLSKAPSHRILAMFRGEREKFLRVDIEAPRDEAERMLDAIFVKGDLPSSREVAAALRDGYTRLLAPSMATEMRAELKERADREAISVFASNLRELLLAPPLGQKRVLAIDPGFRTGCKTVCLDAQGMLLENVTVYPHSGEAGARDAAETIRGLVSEFGIEAVAVGNGTAGRETESFLAGIGLPAGVPVIMVNESGASIYSASKNAREEFPDKDVTVRGAVSIGRRLMDPLAELVKIDPKSIGVGQYQHDVNQPALRAALDDVVFSCVNSVGVDVNTASVELLSYVSGLGPSLARAIVSFRNGNGPFARRTGLKKVPRLGPKAFEQSAGFLRIRGGKDPLDASAVHPESYHIVKKMAADAGCSVGDLMADQGLRSGIDPSLYVTDEVGMPTLTDILAELEKPGRDPREKFEPFSFSAEIGKIEDVREGMRVPGIVTNVTAFGAFIDIGVHQDGLVHISQLADRFVRDPSEIVRVGQKVTVRVLDVDLERKRISLSMKG